MIFPRHFVSTNTEGTIILYPVGRVVIVNGERWKVTRHGKPLSPYGTVYVYGRKQP